jgi:MFS family permease
MMGALIYIPFFVQGVMGVSPTHSGYVTMPMSIAMVLTSAVGGRLMTKTGKYKRFALMGMILMILGMIIMGFMTNIWMAVISMIVFGFGLGLGMPVFSLAVQNAVAPSELGVATASSQLFRNMGGTIGIAVMGTIMATQLASKLKSAISSGQGVDLSKLDPTAAKQFAALQNPQILLDHPKLEQIHQSLPVDMQPIFTKMIDMLRESLGSSLSVVFFSGASFLGLALLLSFFLKEIPLRTTNHVTVPSNEEDKLISG